MEWLTVRLVETFGLLDSVSGATQLLTDHWPSLSLLSVSEKQDAQTDHVMVYFRLLQQCEQWVHPKWDDPPLLSRGPQQRG
jgi:hypothetical protein